jgi:hypothetical protein
MASVIAASMVEIYTVTDPQASGVFDQRANDTTDCDSETRYTSQLSQVTAHLTSRFSQWEGHTRQRQPP